MTSQSHADETVVKERIDKLASQIRSSFKSPADAAHKKRLAIISFENVSEQAKKQDIGRGVAELLANRLAQSGSFTLIERQQLEKILEEQKLGLSGLIDADSAKQVGQLLGAEAIVMGSVSEIGQYYSINSRVVDVESAEVLASASVDIKREDLTKEIIKFMVVVEKRSPFVSALLSAVIPGLGQWNNGDSLKALLFEGASVGLGAVAFTTYTSANQKYDTYLAATNTADVVARYKESQDLYSAIFMYEYALGALWFLNVVDAYLGAASEPEKKIQEQHSSMPFRFQWGRDSSGALIPGLVLRTGF